MPLRVRQKRSFANVLHEQQVAQRRRGRTGEKSTANHMKHEKDEEGAEEGGEKDKDENEIQLDLLEQQHA